MWLSAKEYAGMASELAALRAKVEMLECIISDMDKQVATMEVALQNERDRCDQAVDRLLQIKGLPPVSPTKLSKLDDLSDMFGEEPEEVKAILAEIDIKGAAEALLES